eukprot:2871364-Amphidinium_carterae.1
MHPRTYSFPFGNYTPFRTPTAARVRVPSGASLQGSQPLPTYPPLENFTSANRLSRHRQL